MFLRKDLWFFFHSGRANRTTPFTFKASRRQMTLSSSTTLFTVRWMSSMSEVCFLLTFVFRCSYFDPSWRTIGSRKPPLLLYSTSRIYDLDLVLWWFLNFLWFVLSDFNSFFRYCFSEQSEKIWTDLERDLSRSSLPDRKLQSVSVNVSVGITKQWAVFHFHFNWYSHLCVFLCISIGVDLQCFVIEIISRYGYLTNTKVKFIMVTTDLDVRDADVRNVSTNVGLQFSTAILILIVFTWELSLWGNSEYEKFQGVVYFWRC